MNSFRWLLLVGTMSVFVGLSVYSSFWQSLTYDEIVYIQEGYNALINHTFAIDPYNPPLLKELTTLPLLFINSHDVLQSNIQVFWGRLVTIFLGVCLLVLVFIVGKKIIFSVGLLSVIVLLFDPTFFSNSHLLTLDTGTALFFALSYQGLISLFFRYSLTKLTLTATLFGLALATRVSTIPLLVCTTLFVSLYFIFTKNKPFPNYMVLVTRGLGFGLVTAIVLWATYFFTSETILSFSTDHRRTSVKLSMWAQQKGFTNINSGLTFLQNTPIALGNYLAKVKNTLIRSSSRGSTFFLGSPRDHLTWYMILVTFFYKTPLPQIILVGLGSYVLYAKKKYSLLFLFAFPILLVFLFHILGGLQPLVRYVLPALPFVSLLAGTSLLWAQTLGKKIVIVLLTFWYVFDVVTIFPHVLTYTNVLAGPRNEAVLLFTDSNIDWGQGLPTLMQYINSQQPKEIKLSYFGRDDAAQYGFVSNKPFGSWQTDKICQMHDIRFPSLRGPRMTIISISNWHGCGYKDQKGYAKEYIREVIAGSYLVF